MLDFLWERANDWKRHLLGWFGHRAFRLSSRKLRCLSEAACLAWAAHPKTGGPSWSKRLRETEIKGLPLPVVVDIALPATDHSIPAGEVCKICCGSGARPGT